MKICKIKKRAQFLRVANSKNYISNKFCIIQCDRSKSDVPAVAYVGFTASKKFIGNAVCRNFAKRRMRAALIPILKENALERFDYVIIAKKTLLDCNFREFKERLKNDILKLNGKFSNE